MNIRLIAGTVLCCILAMPAVAQECGHPIAYNGKGAGTVIFDGAAHVAKGLTCASCHEGGVFSSALFEMKRGANPISMRRMELGRSCGNCHDGKQAFSAMDPLNCGKCHRK